MTNNLFSIIASVASIVSLFFALSDKFKSWQKYTINSFFLFLGMTISQLLSMGDTAIKQFTTNQIVVLIVVVSFTVLFSLFIYKYMNNNEITPMIGIIALIALGYVLPKTINTITDSQSFIKNTDYLILSEYYSKNGESMKSSNFLEKYIELESNNLPKQLIDSLKNKSSILKIREIQKIK